MRSASSPSLLFLLAGRKVAKDDSVAGEGLLSGNCRLVVFYCVRKQAPDAIQSRLVTGKRYCECMCSSSGRGSGVFLSGRG